jgi:superoxide reductase
MTQLNQVYKCAVCGNIVEVIHTGAGELVCCNRPMILQEGHIDDEGFEKHLPVLSFEGDELKVTVGEILHPMSEEHYIEWIELIIGDKVERVYLKPTDSPEAIFKYNGEPNYIVRTYCNIHGLWELRM